MPTEDEDLLGRLEHALRPPDVEPSDEEIAALHRAVAGGVPAPAVRRVWPRRALAGVAAAVVLLVMVSGVPVPRPVRAAAHALGLPVDSVEVADAKSAVKELQRALDDGDQERAARASARLRQRLGALSERDRQRIGRRAGPLLERAGGSSGSPPAPGSPPPDGQAPSRPSTRTPSTSGTSSTTTSSSTSSTTTTAPGQTTRATTSTTAPR
ncbi:MAG: hypothetical protein M3N28_00130 [Actinomycetota bacterium]|nr:hypothetical protein [Actinomycetota bacterium]